MAVAPRKQHAHVLQDGRERFLFTYLPRRNPKKWWWYHVMLSQALVLQRTRAFCFLALYCREEASQTRL